jgi:hypothetical protein
MEFKMLCNCGDWKIGMEQIEGAQMFAATRGIKYTGPIFAFCPWCGEPLVEETKEEYVNLAGGGK